jgi:hypothetical protein
MCRSGGGAPEQPGAAHASRGSLPPRRRRPIGRPSWDWRWRLLRAFCLTCAQAQATVFGRPSPLCSPGTPAYPQGQFEIDLLHGQLADESEPDGWKYATNGQSLHRSPSKVTL